MDVVNLLKESGISPSVQRIRILEFLMTNFTHPSVEEIYISLVKEIPTLSKTTVYNTMNLFREKGLIKAVIDEGETKFDGNISEHGHFKCRKCGKIIDFDINSMDLKELTGFKIEEKHTYFVGICSGCIEKK